MIRLSKLLKESPDRVHDRKNDSTHDWSDEDAYVFGYDEDGEFIIANTDADGDSVTHGDLFGERQWSAKFPGRLWTTGKIISFWGKYPTPQELNKILRDIKVNTGLVINPKKWRLDIPKCGKKFVNGLNTGDLIPIADYIKPMTTSKVHSGGDVAHVKSPIQKQELMNKELAAARTAVEKAKILAKYAVPKGMGSMKMKGNMPVAQYQRMRYPQVDETND